MLDAEPDLKVEFPDSSIWPLLAALSVTGLFISSIFTPWGAVLGAVPVSITLTGWFWPKKRQAEERPPEEVKQKSKERWLKLKEQET
jgi:cytochrome c oxidase subunit 1